MSYDEYRDSIIEKVKVTNQMVTYAKAFFIENFEPDTKILINSLLENLEARKPEKIIIHPSIDTEKMISDAEVCE